MGKKRLSVHSKEVEKHTGEALKVRLEGVCLSECTFYPCKGTVKVHGPGGYIGHYYLGEEIVKEGGSYHARGITCATLGEAMSVVMRPGYEEVAEVLRKLPDVYEVEVGVDGVAVELWEAMRRGEAEVRERPVRSFEASRLTGALKRHFGGERGGVFQVKHMRDGRFWVC